MGAAHARPIPPCGDDHSRPPTGARGALPALRAGGSGSA